METNRSMNPMLALVVVAIVIGAGFILLRGSSSSMPIGETPTKAVQQPTASPTATDEAMMKTITLDAGAFYYAPKEIRVKKGDKVKIVMTAKDMMHDFTIDALNVKMSVTQSGMTNSVEFTADTAGTFEYYCGVGQHRANGQVGTLIVE